MAVLPCLPRGHRRDFSPKREKSADPYAQSSRPSTSTSFRTVCLIYARSKFVGPQPFDRQESRTSFERRFQESSDDPFAASSPTGVSTLDQNLFRRSSAPYFGC